MKVTFDIYNHVLYFIKRVVYMLNITQNIFKMILITNTRNFCHPKQLPPIYFNLHVQAGGVK